MSHAICEMGLTVKGGDRGQGSSELLTRDVVVLEVQFFEVREVADRCRD